MIRSTWATRLVVLFSILILLVLWHVGAVILDANVILPTPTKAIHALVELVGTSPFSLHIGTTVLRALESFAIISLSGILLGILAGSSIYIHALLRPFLAICKAVPVMSVILLAFIWFSSGTVPLFSAFLMGFPVMFVQVESGVRSISKKLDEMVRMYALTKKERIFHFILPSLAPSIATGARSSLAMVWKVVIAAEVLTVPRYGVGSRMQMAQVNLETAEVLAWTLIAVVLTVAGDVLFDAALRLPPWVSRQRHRKIIASLGMDGELR